MVDLFSTAQVFLPKKDDKNDPERMLLIRELKSMLHNSQFLSQGEKDKMEKVIPFFSNSVINDLQQTLVRQNLRYLQKKMADTNN
jgi:hypothetical protein